MIAYKDRQERLWLAALALEPKASIPFLISLSKLPFRREPFEEELLRLAQFPSEDGVADALGRALRSPTALRTLIQIRSKFDSNALAPLLTEVARRFWQTDSDRDLGVQLVASFRLTSFEKELIDSLKKGESSNQLSALRALREIETTQDEVFFELANSTTDRTIRHEAILTLASSKSERAGDLVTSLWPSLNALQRRLTLDRLTASKISATHLLGSIKSGSFPKTDLDVTTLDKLNAILPNNPDLQSLTQELTAKFQPALRLDGKNDSYLDTDLTLEGAFTFECWVKLAPGIDNNDGLLGSPGVLDLNFYDARFRVWAGPQGDIAVAQKKMVPEVWTHLAVTRDMKGNVVIYVNGELDARGTKLFPEKLEHLKIGWSGPAKGTDGWMNTIRIWNVALPDATIRANFDRTLADNPHAVGLVSEMGGDDWMQPGKSKLHDSARIEKVDDFPELVTAKQNEERKTKFDHFEALAQKTGDSGKGKMLFTVTCQTCHSVAGQGGQIGPVLNGAGAMGVEGLLRAMLTPNAAMEAGYRTYRVELKDGDVLDGFLVSQNDEAIVLRQPNAQDRRIPQDDVRRASYTKLSLMPEGLLESLPEKDAVDLLAYLKTLK